MKIDDELPVAVLDAIAHALGFRVFYDRREDVDEWTLSAGHGASHVQYVGTRKSICAFLAGYGAMRARAVQMLNDAERANKNTIADCRAYLGEAVLR
jgi:hypothetical protein